MPPLGAAADSVTVPVSEVPLVTELLLKVKPVSVADEVGGGVTVGASRVST